MFFINRLSNIIAHPRVCLNVAYIFIVCALSANAPAALLSGTPTQLSFNGISATDGAGWSAALSNNGRVAVLGGTAVNSVPPVPGAAFVYTETNGAWSDPIPLSMSGIPNDVLAGWSVGVAPDGSQAFVGTPIVNTYVGAVYAYTPENGNWANATPVPLDVSGVPQHSNFGSAIAVSANGQTLVVGASAASNGGATPGKIYVYSLNNGSWGSPLGLPTTGVANGSELGTSVAVSSNGQVVVAGAPQGNSVYVYTQTNGSWGGPVALMVPSGAASNGNSVAISADGTEILTGAPNTNGQAGAVYAYTLSGGKWSLAKTFTVANSGSLGYSVGLSPDGTIAFIGMPGGNTGAIYVSFNSNENWSTPTALSLSGVQLGASLGWFLAVASNGETVLGSAPGANADAGDGYVYSSPASINLVVTPAANPVMLGSNATFNLSFTNTDTANGSFPATTLTNITLTDTLPADTTYVSSDAANGNCSNSGSTVTCTLASLAPGNNSQNPWMPSITVKTPTTAGTFTNTVSASADQPLLGVTNTGTTLTSSSSGNGSGSSGKSGGGALGFPTLLMLSVLMAVIQLRKRVVPTSMKINTRFQLHRILIASCLILISVFSSSVFATVLSDEPIQLSDYGMQQGQLLGWSLALAADGQVAAGGAPAYNRAGTSGTDYTGAAYVYARTGGTWSSPITLSTTGIPTGSFIGGAIALSASGQQVIVSATGATSQGGVYLYNETGGSWNNTPTRTALTLPTGIVGNFFGEGLAISSNGQTLLVGTRPVNGTSMGEIYAYSLSGGTWSNPVALPMTGIPAGLDVGSVLAVSANGQVVAAGGPQWNNPNGDQAEGAAYVWTQNSNGTWKNPVQLAYPSTLDSSLSFFGGAVALSADGTELLVGATGANNQVGAAYVYTDTNGTWSSVPKMLSTTMSNVNSFGSSVALSPDGLTAFMGMPVNDTGYIFMSTKTNGTWSTPVSLSIANLPVSAFLGINLAQGDDGEELLTTGYTVNNDTGALFVYDSPAAITLAASPSAPVVAPGSSLTFDITLTNADQPGSMPATTLNDVVLTDTLPTGTTYVSSNAANGTCNHTGDTVTCTLTSLTPGNNNQNPWAPSITVKTQTTAANLTNVLTVNSNEPLLGSTILSTNATNDVVPTLKSGNLSTATNKAVSGTLQATAGFTGQRLTFTVVSQPSSGNIALTNASTGTFTYTPNSGFSGIDTFVWTAGDGVVTAIPVAESISVGTSSGGSGSSGKTGGGAMGIGTLLAFTCLCALSDRKRSKRITARMS
jgi:uncharacterized repeat protein (TIGR01451 family)